MSERANPLVLGIGNLLLRDEGVGVHVIRELERLVAANPGAVPPGTRLLDGGTLGLELLPTLASASLVVLVDAINLALPGGTVGIIAGDDIEGTLAGHVSPHQVGVADLVGAARLTGVMPPASLVAIRPESIEIGLELSPVVAASLAKAVAATCAELWRLEGAGVAGG